MRENAIQDRLLPFLPFVARPRGAGRGEGVAAFATGAAVDARVTRVERLAVDSEPVSDATTERLRRLLAGSVSSS